MRVSVRHVSSENWSDFAALFEARGGPHYCWCTLYRFPDKPHMNKQAKKDAMHHLVFERVPVGVLAYVDDTPVGWCSIAPRESYGGLQNSRKMPRITSPEILTWTVLCFFVARPFRGQGVSRHLLEGAISYARSQGAAVIEGYPFDTAGITSTHRGHSEIFRRSGFHRKGMRWSLDLDIPTSS